MEHPLWGICKNNLFGLGGLSGVYGLFGTLHIIPINPIIPMSLVWNLPIGTILFLPVFPSLIHFLLDTTLFKEVAFLPLYEPTDKDVALVNECDGDIGDSFIWTLLYLFTEISIFTFADWTLNIFLLNEKLFFLSQTRVFLFEVCNNDSYVVRDVTWA